MKTTIITRGLALSVLAAGALVASAQPAHADGKYQLAAGEGCDFALEWAWAGGNLHAKEFKDDEGNVVRMLTAGKGTVNTYTNLETGKFVSVRTDGSVSQTVYHLDGSQTVTATGHNGLIMFPTDVPAGPSTIQYTGKIVYTISPDGVFTLESTSGQALDVCAALAD